MHSSYSRWEQHRRQHRNLSPLLQQHLWQNRQLHLHRQQAGPAAVVRQATPASSVASVEHLSLWQKAGPVPAAQLIKENSAASAEQRSRLENLYISAISADGNRKIPRILRNSVPSAEIPLMTAISSNDCSETTV